MIIGLIALGVLLVLVLFGVLRPVFEKLRLTTTAAVIFILAMAVGIIIPPIYIGGRFAFSIGGWIVPMVLCVYLLIRVGFSWDLLRSFIAMVVTAGAVLLINMYMPMGNVWLRILAAFEIGVVAGGVSYLIGRSRRGSLVAAFMGIYIAAVALFFINMARGIETTLILGAGYQFDALVLSAITAVALASVVGAVREHNVSRRHAANLSFEASEDFYAPQNEKDEFFDK